MPKVLDQVKDQVKSFFDTGRFREFSRPREIVDGTPMAPPIGYKKQPSVFDQMRDMIRSEKLRAAAEEMGAESFDEADDFDIGDDVDPISPHELRELEGLETFNTAREAEKAHQFVNELPEDRLRRSEGQNPPPPPAGAPQAVASPPVAPKKPATED